MRKLSQSSTLSILDFSEILLNIFLSNQFFFNSTDKIEEQELIKWLQVEYYRSQKSMIEKKEISEFLLLLSLNGVIRRHLIKDVIFIQPTKKYFELQSFKNDLKYHVVHFFRQKEKIEGKSNFSVEITTNELYNYLEKCDGIIDELRNFFYDNPFFNELSDIITEDVLVKWIDTKYYDKYQKRTNISAIYALISQLFLNNELKQKNSGKFTFIQPTEYYFKIIKNKNNLTNQPEIHNIPFQNEKEEILDVTPFNEYKESINVIESIPERNSFYNFLINRVENFGGKNAEIIRYCPNFFRLLCKIINCKYSDWHTKILISSSLGYFVLEEDAIPDDLEDGYIDDLFLITYVLREIRDTISPQLIEENWDGEEDICDLIENIYEKCYEIIPDHILPILQKVGIHKFTSLQLDEYTGSYPQRIAKIGSEKRELLAVAAFLIQKLDEVKINPVNFSAIKNYVQNIGDYDEIHRLIELSKMDHELIEKYRDDKNVYQEDYYKKMAEARNQALFDD